MNRSSARVSVALLATVAATAALPAMANADPVPQNNVYAAPVVSASPAVPPSWENLEDERTDFVPGTDGVLSPNVIDPEYSDLVHERRRELVEAATIDGAVDGAVTGGVAGAGVGAAIGGAAGAGAGIAVGTAAGLVAGPLIGAAAGMAAGCMVGAPALLVGCIPGCDHRRHDRRCGRYDRRPAGRCGGGRAHWWSRRCDRRRRGRCGNRHRCRCRHRRRYRGFGGQQWLRATESR